MAENKCLVKSPAQRIFSLCDQEGKGFVTKKDMLERMQNRLPLKPDQLEVVFDSLDRDGNGRLTFEEFVEGFGVHLEENKENAAIELLEQNPQPTTDKGFDYASCEVMRLIESLGAGEVLQDENAVKEITDLLQGPKNKGRILEKILWKVSQYVQSKEQERIAMEDYMRQQIETREEKHKKMYEEMELQINKEFKRIDLEGKMREAAITHELTEEIMKKKQQIEHLRKREIELEETLSAVREGANTAKHQVSVLLKEKKFLEGHLETQTRLVDDFRGVCERLRRESVAERRQRAMAALAVAQDIAVERAGLVSQLHMLRAINTRLMDESDMRKWGSLPDHEPCEKYPPSVTIEDVILKQAEVDDEYQEDELKGNNASHENGQAVELDGNVKPKSLFDELSGSIAVWQKASGVDVTAQTEPCRIGADDTRAVETQTDESTQLTEKTISVLDVRDRVNVEAPETDGGKKTLGTTADPRFGVPCVVETSYAFIQPFRSRVTNVNSFVGFHSGRWTHEVNFKRREVITPTNVYKIIVLGDSDVGKTSFIRRFCTGEYTALVNGRSAAGIDSSVRCLAVGDDQHIALHFWDAPSRKVQGKCWSFPGKLFRRADAIVVMYDVTSESSFKNARRWLLANAEETADSTVRVLIGNKVDLLEPREADERDETVERSEESRSMAMTLTRFPERVSTAAAIQLAQSFDGEFFETSAKSGYMVQQTLVAIAAKLHVKERSIMESITLDAVRGEELGHSNEGKVCV